MGAVTEQRCPRCRLKTMRGLSDLGLDVVLDLEELDPRGELDAVVGGRHTWTLHTYAGQIAHRPPRVIIDRPAGTRPRQTVHRDHRCEEVPPP